MLERNVSAVTGAPDGGEKRNPARIWKVYVRPSADTSGGAAATSGTSRRPAARGIRVGHQGCACGVVELRGIGREREGRVGRDPVPLDSDTQLAAPARRSCRRRDGQRGRPEQPAARGERGRDRVEAHRGAAALADERLTDAGRDPEPPVAPRQPVRPVRDAARADDGEVVGAQLEHGVVGHDAEPGEAAADGQIGDPAAELAPSDDARRGRIDLRDAALLRAHRPDGVVGSAEDGHVDRRRKPRQHAAAAGLDA